VAFGVGPRKRRLHDGRVDEVGDLLGQRGLSGRAIDVGGEDPTEHLVLGEFVVGREALGALRLLPSAAAVAACAVGTFGGRRSPAALDDEILDAFGLRDAAHPLDLPDDVHDVAFQLLVVLACR